MSAFRCEVFPEVIDASVAFYVDVLGFDVVRDDRPREDYVALQKGTARLGLARRVGVDTTGRRPPVGVELVLEVDDVDAARNRVSKYGWPVEEDLTRRPWGLTDFRVTDPDGYYWRLTSIE